MSYCPSCHTEYQPGFSTCADCGKALVPGTPRFCPHCKGFVTEDDTFCDTCGRIQQLPMRKDRPECSTHFDRDAVAGCVLCGKPLCAECVRTIDDISYCEDDSHYRINQEYTDVYKTSDDIEAQMLKANLEGAGIDAVVFNQHDHVYYVTMGMLAIVKVMVRRKDEKRAQEIIQDILSTSINGNGGDE